MSNPVGNPNWKKKPCLLTGLARRRCEHCRIPRTMYRNAKQRAKRDGVPFDITFEDIMSVWPSDNRCPVFYTEFRSNRVPNSGKLATGSKLYSPTLDRKNNDLGYVKGNIGILSRKANSVKSDLPPEIFQRFLDYLAS